MAIRTYDRNDTSLVGQGEWDAWVHFAICDTDQVVRRIVELVDRRNGRFEAFASIMYLNEKFSVNGK